MTKIRAIRQILNRIYYHSSDEQLEQHIRSILDGTDPIEVLLNLRHYEERITISNCNGLVKWVESWSK